MDIALPTPDVIGRLRARMRTELASAAEEWSAVVSTLTRWEDDHLLDAPTAQLLADHRATVERLSAFGRLISLVTEDSAFPDRLTAELVAATQQVLRDKLRMWHGPRLDRAESDHLLAELFPE